MQKKNQFMALQVSMQNESFCPQKIYIIVAGADDISRWHCKRTAAKIA